MRVLDSRRLRGRSLGSPGPAAVAEVLLEADDASRIEASWRAHLRRALEAVGRASLADGARVRPFAGGLALLVPAPLDVLLAVVDLNDWAIEATRRELARRRSSLGRDAVRRLRRRFAEDTNPRLAPISEAARARDVPVLSDDDELTLGLGARSKSFAMRALPDVSELGWAMFGTLPVALVTGTNGKTTTTRLAARMVKAAGLVPGNSSTDGVTIDERVEQEGDWTGAEAARMVLRDPRVEVAILETARGGILRRGLALDGVDAALVTNVTADHLGEYGVMDVATMARAKLVVTEAVRAGGSIVLPERDDAIWGAFKAPEGRRVVLFSDRPAAKAAAHVAAGGHAFVLEQDAIVHRGAGERHVLAPVVDVPITFGGEAPHNIKNALAASALAWALGVPREAIAAGLGSFGRQPTDNPGRGHLLTLPSGVRVLCDFGHNPAALRDLLALSRSLAPSGERILVTTLPGDRSDDAFVEYAQTVVAGGVTRAFVWEKPVLLRGRRTGEITLVLARALTRAGCVAETQPDEVGALRAALRRATAADLVVAAPYLARLDASELAAL